MAFHPDLPIILTGSEDGSVQPYSAVPSSTPQYLRPPHRPGSISCPRRLRETSEASGSFAYNASWRTEGIGRDGAEPTHTRESVLGVLYLGHSGLVGYAQETVLYGTLGLEGTLQKGYSTVLYGTLGLEGTLKKGYSRVL